jgi:hypothetical protein
MSSGRRDHGAADLNFPSGHVGSGEMSPLRIMAALENGYGRGPERSLPWLLFLCGGRAPGGA